MRIYPELFMLLFLAVVIGGCSNKTNHSKIVYGKTGQVSPKVANIKTIYKKTDNIEWLSRKTEKGIEWYPAKITYDKQGHRNIIPMKQKIIPGTTSKIERHCHGNAIGDVTCKLIKTVYDKKGNILKRVILQRQRAIHRPLPGPKPIEIKEQRKNKN